MRARNSEQNRCAREREPHTQVPRQAVTCPHVCSFAKGSMGALAPDCDTEDSEFRTDLLRFRQTVLVDAERTFEGSLSIGGSNTCIEMDTRRRGKRSDLEGAPKDWWPNDAPLNFRSSEQHDFVRTRQCCGICVAHCNPPAPDYTHK